MNYELSRAAERDLRELRAYLAAESQSTADDVLRRLTKAILLIRSNPSIGRPGPQDHVREWSVPGLPFVIPYTVRSSTVYVIRIWHTSRQRPDTW